VGETDCNINGIDDSCDVDCGSPGGPCDVPGCGLSSDCQGDDQPDECQLALTAGDIYVIDDGSRENSLGYGAAEQTVGWINHFSVQAGAEVITHISTGRGSIANGSTATAYLWSDPNGDGSPADGIVLASAPATIGEGVPLGELIVIDIPDTSPGPAGTSFFVGVIAVGEDAHPAPMDETSSLELSWFIGDTSVPIDPNDLANASHFLAQPHTFGFPSNFMVRAVHAGSLGDTNHNGVPDACDCTGSGDCNDGNACTDDACVSGSCVNSDNTASCDDGDACTENDMCSGGVCAGTPPVSVDDTCDGIDDDCDGTADEDYASVSTNCGLGACASTGTTLCVAGSVVDSCVPGTPSPSDETCDGIDDDCDGTPDDDYVSVGTFCGVGACASTGSTSCVAGAVVDDCMPGPPAADDDCDGVDDDCDGTPDDEYASLSTNCGLGACASTGSTSCLAGVVVDDCTPGSPAADDATCDGIDDDCDGSDDEDYASVSTNCGVGACVASGSTSCVAGVIVDDCIPGSPADDDVTCDGIDDDCDGSDDEDYASLSTDCGVGACAANGSTSCVAGAVVDDCTPGIPALDDATCDGIDDDCDGANDEEYASVVTNCGIGACQANGATSCVSGVVEDDCVPGSPSAEVCDGVDNNCDGTSDEAPAADADCDDTLFCTGVETCAGGACVAGTDPCSVGDCHEDIDECVICSTAADCVDLDDAQAGEPGIPVIDDVCTWGSCDAGSCNVVNTVVPADVGGAFGVCFTDTFCNVHDQNHILACFAGTNACESINIDAGSSFGVCGSDGFCNVHDVNHVLSCFAGTNPCQCGPSPGTAPIVEVVDQVDIAVVPDAAGIRAGQTVDVHVFISELADLQSFQLQLAASGGRRGELALVDVSIGEAKDFVFTNRPDAFDAVNVDRGQVLGGVADEGVVVRNNAHLATFTFEASRSAYGSFVVDIVESDSIDSQTAFIASENGWIEIGRVAAAVISVR
jgi:hypothetical protein